MKALCVTSPHNISIEERSATQIQSPDEVLIKVKAGGICGSEMHIFHDRPPVATYGDP